MKNALNQAIDCCIEQGILKDFLGKYRTEVVGILLEELEMEKYERSLRAEGLKKGLKKGREEGRREERVKGVEELMANLQVDLPRACELLGITSGEYQNAKRHVKQQTDGR